MNSSKILHNDVQYAIAWRSLLNEVKTGIIAEETSIPSIEIEDNYAKPLQVEVATKSALATRNTYLNSHLQRLNEIYEL